MPNMFHIDIQIYNPTHDFKIMLNTQCFKFEHVFRHVYNAYIFLLKLAHFHCYHKITNENVLKSTEFDKIVDWI